MSLFMQRMNLNKIKKELKVNKKKLEEKLFNILMKEKTFVPQSKTLKMKFISILKHLKDLLMIDKNSSLCLLVLIL
jgi:hypothetical protein